MNLLLRAALPFCLAACGAPTVSSDAGTPGDARDGTPTPADTAAAPTDAREVSLTPDCGFHCGTTAGGMISISETCVFTLPCGYGETDFGGLAVFINGMTVPRDRQHVEGWDYVDAAQTTVQLYGSPCTDARAMTGEVFIAQGC